MTDRQTSDAGSMHDENRKWSQQFCAQDLCLHLGFYTGLWTTFGCSIGAAVASKALVEKVVNR